MGIILLDYLGQNWCPYIQENVAVYAQHESYRIFYEVS